MISPRRRVLFIATPTAVVIGALALWLYTTEWVEIREDQGYSTAAMLNPFLGAGLFLERAQVQVEPSPGLKLLDDLPPPSHTLLVASSWRTLSRRRVDALIDWVVRGGHLIMPGTTPWNALRGVSGDPLLDFLKVQVHEQPEFSDELTPSPERRRAREELMEMARASIDTNALCGPVEDLIQLSFSENEGPVVALLSSNRSLVDAGANASLAASNQYGTQLLQFEVGEGLITVMTTLRLWRNRVIECHDHAHMLRLLVGASEKLWWLYDTELPALPVLIWRSAALALLGALMFTVLLAWRAGFRFGPAVSHDEQARRQLMEHVEGVARLYWQHRSSDKLLDEMREEVMRQYRHADHRSEDAAAGIAALTGIDEGDVRWALSVKAENRDASFRRAVSILQKLRKSL